MMQAIGSGIQFLLTAIGFWRVVTWCYGRSPAGRKMSFHCEMHELAYENRDLFVSDIAYSVPAFLAMGERRAEGVLMARWWYAAFGAPSNMFQRRDGMEAVVIFSAARNAIKATLAGPKRPGHQEIYDQLYPRFNQMCEQLETLAQKYQDFAPIPLKQERLPAL